nr:helix-turn-helix transcriptional regulator [Streptomyces sp. SID13031]
MRADSASDPLAALTERERDVLALMAEGRSNSAIADRLTVSLKTVESHIANIFSKLGLYGAQDDHRRVLAVLAALQGSP